ncbi:MAG: 2-oxoacid:ferredoxin oxidoreductase subunit beta [Fibrobacterota bacterium]
MQNNKTAWCPGCGNFGILKAVQDAVSKSGRNKSEFLFVSGIGQAAKLPHYIEANCFNGLHGRALPVAAGARMVRKDLKIVVTTGDGDCYGEGGNHFIHNIRRNIDITVIVHDNRIYGLTKGQASPTTSQGFKTDIQIEGALSSQFRPLETALIGGAGFVARGFSGNPEQLTGLILEALEYKGFSLIDVFQPCVSFNKVNTMKWFKDRIYNLSDKAHDPSDKASAMREAAKKDEEGLPVGIFYKQTGKSFPEYDEMTIGENEASGGFLKEHIIS